MTNPNVRPDLEALKVLQKAATPTPWEAQSTQTEGEDRGVGIIGLRLDEAGEPMFTPTNGIVAAALPCPTEIDSNDYARVEANAALLVGAVNALPDLIAHIERLEGLVEEAAGWFEQYAVEHYAKAKTAPDYGEQHGREVKGKTNRDRATYLRATLSQGTSND